MGKVGEWPDQLTEKFEMFLFFKNMEQFQFKYMEYHAPSVRVLAIQVQN